MNNANTVLPMSAWILTIISSSLSIIGSVAIFWTFLRYRYVRNTTRRLLLFLTAADFMTAGGNLVGSLNIYHYVHERPMNNNCSGTDDSICVAQSFLTTFTSLSSFLWTDAITVYFYVSLVWQRPAVSKKLLTPFHIICWGVPGVISLMALGFGVLGSDYSNYAVSSGARCWISGCLDRSSRILWMLLSGKAWELLTYVFSTALIIIYFYQLKRSQQRRSIFDAANGMGANFRQEDRNFFAVPLVLYFLRLWGTFRFFMASFSSGDDLTLSTLDFVLLILQCIGDSGQAFCNFLLFCLLDKPVRQWMFRCCRRCSDAHSIQDNEPRYGSIDNQIGVQNNEPRYGSIDNQIVVQNNEPRYGSF